MGSRAVITHVPFSDNNVGVYIHWNGDRPAVQGFLNAARYLGYRDPEKDPEYGLARLTELLCVFFGGSLNVGIGICSNMDYSDNGIYVVGKDWEIIERRYFDKEDVEDEDRTKMFYDESIKLIKKIL